MSSTHQSHKGRSGLLVSLALLLVVGLGWFFRQDLSDWWRLRDYDPSSQIVALADQTTMTTDGRRIFYTTHPDIADKDTFNAHCRDGAASEYSIVLGCYISTGKLYGNMYLYDINDPRLSGVMQVTAAHEMLHAAYDRLDDKERQRIDALLQETYQNLPDGRVKQTIAQYEASDPASVPNELHSIIGTELGNLPPELETYYSRYFTNRAAIVRFSEQYEAEFSRRQDQVTAYDRQLTEQKAIIEANQKDIDRQRVVLDQQRAQLDAYESAGNAAAFNVLVSNYNQGVARYNELVTTTRDQIEAYNSLVETRNNLALEVQQLTKAIDSRPQSL